MFILSYSVVFAQALYFQIVISVRLITLVTGSGTLARSDYTPRALTWRCSFGTIA